MTTVLDILRVRGFIDQTTHDHELDVYFRSETVVSYVGFDPTAASLHVGNLVPIMALLHMKLNGHKPIAVVGGGTVRIGDPSGKSEEREKISSEEVRKNIYEIKRQLINFTTVKGEHALLVNNADWLQGMEYIPFLQNIGRYFSVNRMLKAETYKSRLASKAGLNFGEFGYMVLQAYDFNKLYEKYRCCLQMGGSDQWGNIVAGIDLVRKKNKKTVFGITFPLITTSNGMKMGKTVDGAVWLDPSMTSPYDYYQYWVNVSDADLERFLSLFTLLPMEEIKQIKSFNTNELIYAKHILAFEATFLAHGESVAINAHQAALSMFGGQNIPRKILPSCIIPRASVALIDSLVPSVKMKIMLFREGIPAFRLFNDCGLVDSASSARRLINQGGAYLNGKRIVEFDYRVGISDINNMEIVLKAGKKRFIKIKIIDDANLG